jgi:4-amino-4-deoxy-L-arabinose transferase-like glycosyltransferase
LAYRATGASDFHGKILYALLGSLTGVFLFLLLAPSGRLQAWWCGLLWALYPTSIISTNLLCTEVPAAFFLAASACVLGVADRTTVKRRWLLYALAGTLTGVTSLVRPATHLFIAGVLAILLPMRRFSKNLLLPGIFFLGILLPLLCWGWRNYHVLGKFTLQPTEIGSSLAVTTEYLADPVEERSDSTVSLFRNSHGEFESGRLGALVGKNRIWSAIHKPGFILHMINNQYWFWHFDQEMLFWVFEGREHSSGTIASDAMFKEIIESGYLCLLFLALIGALRLGLAATDRHSGVCMLMLYFVGSVLLSCVFRSDPRYHFLLMLPLCIFAGRGLTLLSMYGTTRLAQPFSKCAF